MFVIKYVYGEIITRGMHSDKIILAVPQTRTVGRQWLITYMQSHVTFQTSLRGLVKLKKIKKLGLVRGPPPTQLSIFLCFFETF